MSGLRSLTLAIPLGEDGRNNLPQATGGRPLRKQDGENRAEFAESP